MKRETQKEEGGGGKEEREGTGRGVEGGKGMRTSGLPLQESAFLFQEREEERWARGKMEEEGEEGNKINSLQNALSLYSYFTVESLHFLYL